MNTTAFSELEYGYVYLCYAGDKSRAKGQEALIANALQKHLSSYKVRLLETADDFAGKIVARRFNLGVVAGKCAVLLASLKPYSDADAVVSSFVKTLFDVDSLRRESVLELTESAVRAGCRLADCVCLSGEKPDEEDGSDSDCFTETNSVSKPTGKHKGGFLDILGSFSHGAVCGAVSGLVSFGKVCGDELGEIEEAEVSAGSLLTEDDADEGETEEQKARRQICEMITSYVAKYGKLDLDALQNAARGKVSLANNGISKLVVNNDCKVVLPDFNEVVLRLPPVSSSVYVLFLLHPEGIRLRDMERYQTALENIYSDISHKDKARVEETAKRLCLYSNDLNQVMSKIRSMIKKTLNYDDLAEHYFIQGKAGDLYYIPVARMEGMVEVKPKFNV